LSKKVLLVDDEENALVALSKILREDGYDVAIAGTEEEAIDRLDEGSFDFIITDLFLFHRSCVNLLDKIKGLKERTPVILTSGHEDVERYIKESNLLDIMLLSKPIAYDQLKRLIEKMAKRGKLNGESGNDSSEKLTGSTT